MNSSDLTTRLKTGTAEDQRALLEECAIAIWPAYASLICKTDEDMELFSAIDAMLDAGAYESAALLLCPDHTVSVSFDWPPGIAGATCGAILLIIGHEAHTEVRAVAQTPALAIASAAVKARGL